MVTFAQNHKPSFLGFKFGAHADKHWGVSRIDQTHIFNPGDDGQRIMVVAFQAGIDFLTLACSPISARVGMMGTMWVNKDVVCDSQAPRFGL